MTDGDSGDRTGRFRRPDWKGPEPDGEQDERSRPNLPAVDSETQARELGLVLKPLKDLADAFRENSETLRSLAEGQARLGKRMERSDRSEAVIQSTQALNDTFRGVQRTQERLMGRLEGEKKRPYVLVGFVVVLVGALVGGTLWYLLGWVDERDEKSRGGERADWSAVLARSEDRKTELADEVTALTEDLTRERRVAEEAREGAEELRSRIEELEETIANMREAQAGLSRLNQANATLSSENARLEREVTRLEGELQDLGNELAERDSEIARQARKIEDLARKAVGAPAPPEPGTPEEVPAEEGAAKEAAPIPESAARDPAELARVTSLLNRLLLDSPGGEAYRIRKIGGIRGKILYDVVMLNLDENGAEAKRIEGGECRVVVDEIQRRVEFRFRNGHIVYYGVRAPFWGGTYVVPVVNIDPSAWLRSGLTLIDTVR